MSSRIFAVFVLLVATTALVSTGCTAQAGFGVQNVESAVPTLKILSPKDGETITLPSAVRFAVTGFTLAKEEGHIEVFMRGSDESGGVALETSDEPGLAYLPDNKFFAGRRDLIFVLAKADRTHLENSEARVTISGLTIQGRR